MMLTHALYDLAARPEYIPLLRDEIRTELAATGGHFTKPVLNNLWKLDSFMREVQRCSPVSLS